MENTNKKYGGMPITHTMQPHSFDLEAKDTLSLLISISDSLDNLYAVINKLDCAMNKQHIETIMFLKTTKENL